MIKRLKLTVVMIALALGNSYAQELPQPSPYAEVMQKVGLTDVTIQYSRPGVKDRTIFGGLEAYGEVWRTGANAATKIILSTDAKIGGVDVKAGTYSILTVPGESEWKVMVNADTKVSEGSYDAAKNVAEFSVKGMENDMVESMTFSFANVKVDGVDLVFEWEKTKWIVPIMVDVHGIADKNIEDEIAGIFRIYNSSARYYLDNDKDLDKALAWSLKSVELDERFWNVYTLSLIYNARGEKDKAIETAKKSLTLSEKAEYKPYIKFNQDNIANWSK